MNPIVLGGAAFLVALGAVAIESSVVTTPSFVATADACETVTTVEPEALAYPKDRVGDNLPPVAKRVHLDWSEPTCDMRSYIVSAVSSDGEVLGLAHIPSSHTLGEITPPVPVASNTQWSVHSE